MRYFKAFLCIDWFYTETVRPKPIAERNEYAIDNMCISRLPVLNLVLSYLRMKVSPQLVASSLPTHLPAQLPLGRQRLRPLVKLLKVYLETLKVYL